MCITFFLKCGGMQLRRFLHYKQFNDIKLNGFKVKLRKAAVYHLLDKISL